MVEIRDERPDDADAIRTAHRRTFDGENEAVLVDRLRGDGTVVASLVAVADGGVVGRVLFSHAPVATEGGPVRGAALAPGAVLSERQGPAIGTAPIGRAWIAAGRAG